MLAKVPQPPRDELPDLLAELAGNHVIRHLDERVQYLLTVVKNGNTAEAAGGAVYVFGLVPDFALFGHGALSLRWTGNWKARTRLGEVGQPVQRRLAALGLRPDTLQGALFFGAGQNQTSCAGQKSTTPATGTRRGVVTVV